MDTVALLPMLVSARASRHARNGRPRRRVSLCRAPLGAAVFRVREAGSRTEKMRVGLGSTASTAASESKRDPFAPPTPVRHMLRLLDDLTVSDEAVGQLYLLMELLVYEHP